MGPTYPTRIQHGSNIQVPSCGEGVRSRLRLPGPAGRLETEGTRDSNAAGNQRQPTATDGNRRQPTALWHCHGKSCERRERSEAEKNSMNVFKIGQIRSQPAFHESIFRSSRCSMFKCLNGARIEGPKSPTVQSCL